MIRAGVLTDDKDRIGKIEIFERYGAFTKAQHLFHSGAARFMAHIRTIGQIVRAKLPHEM